MRSCLLVMAMLTVACTDLGGLSSSGGTTGTPDGSTSPPTPVPAGDAGSGADAEAGAEQPPLGDGTFESAGAGFCGPDWKLGNSATMEGISPGQAGNGACRLCTTATGLADAYLINTRLFSAGPYAGKRLDARAWLRFTDANVTFAQLLFLARNQDQAVVGEGRSGELTTPGPAWKPAELLFDVPPDATSLELSVWIRTSSPACVDVDSVSLALVP